MCACILIIVREFNGYFWVKMFLDVKMQFLIINKMKVFAYKTTIKTNFTDMLSQLKKLENLF